MVARRMRRRTARPTVALRRGGVAARAERSGSAPDPPARDRRGRARRRQDRPPRRWTGASSPIAPQIDSASTLAGAAAARMRQISVPVRSRRCMRPVARLTTSACPATMRQLAAMDRKKTHQSRHRGADPAHVSGAIPPTERLRVPANAAGVALDTPATPAADSRGTSRDCAEWMASRSSWSSRGGTQPRPGRPARSRRQADRRWIARGRPCAYSLPRIAGCGVEPETPRARRSP